MKTVDREAILEEIERIRKTQHVHSAMLLRLLEIKGINIGGYSKLLVEAINYKIPSTD